MHDIVILCTKFVKKVGKIVKKIKLKILEKLYNSQIDYQIMVKSKSITKELLGNIMAM